jgi:hypothetical protein
MTHTHQQTKTPQPSSHLPAQSTWARPAPAFEADHDDMAVQDIETQLANADRLGHHIEDVPIQAQTIAQRFGGAASFTLDDATASRINRARGSGQSLPDDVLRQMGDTLDYDFSGVRVHTGSEAHGLNEQLYARAFTTGQDVFFRDGEYNPGSSSGQQLIMHELAHVVQQSTGRVSGNGSGMTVRPAGDVFEQEADTLAQEASFALQETRGQAIDRGIPRRKLAVKKGTLTQSQVQCNDNEKAKKEIETKRADFTTSFFVNDEQIIRGLVSAVGSLKITELKYGKIKIVSVSEFIDAAAKDRAQKIDGDSTRNFEAHRRAVKEELKENQARGFTDWQDTVWILSQGLADSDMIHELVHVLSGGGGQNKLRDFSNQLNEGFTQYFTIRVCKNIGIKGEDIKEAYPRQVSLVQALVAAHGLDIVYKAYFRGEVENLLSAMARKYLERHPNGGAEAAVKKRIKNFADVGNWDIIKKDFT